MRLHGLSLLAGQPGQPGGATFQAADPATGNPLDPVFHAATPADLDRAAHAAAQAFPGYRALTGAARGRFLRTIAERLEAHGDAWVDRAVAETGLPPARLVGERARTCHQLRAFATLVEEGSWVDARIDRAQPDRQPLPKPDVRSLLRPLGPVAVFGASNFPFAFSVAGGDTASALAAGCPVVCKAHPAHPGTGEIAARAIHEAVQQCQLDPGVFSLLFDDGHEIGRALVQHPAIKAAGFTGSQRGGLALIALAQRRPEPIPIYAEMGSVNPVFLLPGAVRERAAALAEGLAQSITLGVGQFCTKPGLLFAPREHAAPLREELGRRLAAAPPGCLLHRGIRDAFQSATARRAAVPGVRTVASSAAGQALAGARASAALFVTDVATFQRHPELAEEIFGPTALLIEYDNSPQLLDLAAALSGHLTASLHATAEDVAAHPELLALLESKVGRLIFDQYPTGVEVCASMVHGGPFPATGDGRSTSVGTRAILRFTRPVCFQNAPISVLPPELHDDNPLGLTRLVDGQLVR